MTQGTYGGMGLLNNRKSKIISPRLDTVRPYSWGIAWGSWHGPQYLNEMVRNEIVVVEMDLCCIACRRTKPSTQSPIKYMSDSLRPSVRGGVSPSFVW